MTENDLSYALGQAILPVLCDNTRLARQVAGSIFNRYGTVSLIFGKRRFIDLFALSYSTLKLPQTTDDRLRAEVLCDIADEYDDALPVLIPCSPKAIEFTKKCESELEGRYIIASPSVFLNMNAEK